MATDEGATHESSTTTADPDTGPAAAWMDPTALTDRVIDTVDRVKEKTTDNAVLALRVIVFGLVISVLAITTLLMLVILLVRIFDAYLPIGAGVGDATWAAHGFTGVIFCVLGLGAWLSRRGSTKPLMVAGVIDLVFIVVIVCYGLFS